MGQSKGGLKLRRGSKHKNMYAAQFLRTARNKARQKAKRKASAEFWKDQRKNEYKKLQ